MYTYIVHLQSTSIWCTSCCTHTQTASPSQHTCLTVPQCLCFADHAKVCSILSVRTHGNCGSQTERTVCVGGRHCGQLIAITNKQQRCVQECTHHQSSSDVGRENSWRSSAQFWRWGAVILAQDSLNNLSSLSYTPDNFTIQIVSMGEQRALIK